MIMKKAVLTGALWMFGWLLYFSSISAPFTLINFGIAFAPLILAYLYFMIFVWDD